MPPAIAMPQAARSARNQGVGREKVEGAQAKADAPLPFAPRPSRCRPGLRRAQTEPPLQQCCGMRWRASVGRAPDDAALAPKHGASERARARAHTHTHRLPDLASPESTATPAACTSARRDACGAFASLPASCSLHSRRPRTPARRRGAPPHSASCRPCGTALALPGGAKPCAWPARHTATAKMKILSISAAKWVRVQVRSSKLRIRDANTCSKRSV